MKTKNDDLRDLLTKALVAIDNENAEAKNLVSACITIIDETTIRKVYAETEEFAEKYGESLEVISSKIEKQMGLHNMILASTPDEGKESKNLTVGSLSIPRLADHIWCLLANFPQLRKRMMEDMMKVGKFDVLGIFPKPPV